MLKRKSSVKIIASSMIAMMMMSGCTNIITQNNANKIETADVEKAIGEIKETIKSNKKFDIKRKVWKTAYIDLTTPKRISVGLSTLGEIDGRIYYLDKDSEDIALPILSSNLNYKPKSFNDLKLLLEDLTDYTIRITANKYNENRPKVVTVKRKTANFENTDIDLKVNANIDVADVLEQVARETGYNVGFVQEDSDNLGGGGDTEVPNSNSLDYFKGKRITFYGDNVQSLLDYISESLDLYVDVVPKKKMIIFSQFKQKNFKLTAKNQVIDGSLSVSGATEDGGGGTESRSSSVQIDLYNEFEETAKTILKGKSTSEEGKGYCDVLHNGDVITYGKKSSLESIEKLVNNFNKDYGRTYKILLTSYDVVLNRENSIGVDLDILTGNFKAVTDVVAKSVLDYSNPDGTKKLFMDSLNEFGRVVKINNYAYNLTNHIPKYKNKLENQDYFKKTTLTQIGTNSDGVPLYETEPTIEKAQEGMELNLWAAASGDRINLSINAVIKSILSFDEKSLDGKTVTLLRDTNDSFVSDLVLKDGEEVVVDKLSITEKAENYEGSFPLDNFIIGGASGGKFVKRLTVITARVEENQRGRYR